jgi:hypothetical protein
MHVLIKRLIRVQLISLTYDEWEYAFSRADEKLGLDHIVLAEFPRAVLISTLNLLAEQISSGYTQIQSQDILRQSLLLFMVDLHRF